MSNIVNKVKEAVTHRHDKPSESTNAGPHDSNIANKLDPRVDSDLDHRGANTAAGYDTTTAGSTTGGAGLTGAGTATSYDNANTTTTAGPHDSNIANKLDPRVDSDRSQYGTTTGGVTTRGGATAYDTNTYSTNAGPHDSNIANKLDPRVDSDLDNRARYENLGAGIPTAGGSSYNTPGSGTAQQTAGPHDSNIANKLDPRVDSDLYGSGTVGGDATNY
jgi:hypothetical protein